MGLSPYDILVVASLVQQESNSQDFPKVAQVIYNRLHAHHTLEFDSTVNYPLEDAVEHLRVAGLAGHRDLFARHRCAARRRASPAR
jgi:cell division protein YceG involved in septum cleavage